MLLRRYRIVLSACLAAAIAVAIGGCGGKQTAPTNNATVAPPASPVTEIQREINALPLAQMAPIPKKLTCKDAIVWVNTAKKSYHESGDPYYGRTKHGAYMCRAAADAAGYHMAGARHERIKI